MVDLLQFCTRGSLILFQISELLESANLEVKFPSQLAFDLFSLDADWLIEVQLAEALVKFVNYVLEKCGTLATDEVEQDVPQSPLVSFHNSGNQFPS